MDAAADGKLTASQEDYLEAIWALIWEQGIARVRDIAGRLCVSMPSVTSALKVLAKRKLVEYSPHKYVTLSDRGLELAQGISARHDMLRKFLTEVLDMEEQLADGNACRIEHAVDEVVLQRLDFLARFMSDSQVRQKWLGQLRSSCAQQDAGEPACPTALGRATASDGVTGDKRVTTLADLEPGKQAVIIRTNATAATNQRLAVMGMTRNAVVTVVRIAPLGDPIEVKIRGYSLSLRKAQARGVEVEALQ